MSKGRWLDIEADFASAKQHLSEAVAAYRGGKIAAERAASELPGDRPALLGTELAEAALELLRFRHVAMHSYDRFKPARAEPSVVAAETFLSLVDVDLQRFRGVIDPP